MSPISKKHSNHWERALIIIFTGSGCFQFPETVVYFYGERKPTLYRALFTYKFSLFYRSRKCRVESAKYNCNKLL